MAKQLKLKSTLNNLNLVRPSKRKHINNYEDIDKKNKKKITGKGAFFNNFNEVDIMLTRDGPWGNAFDPACAQTGPRKLGSGLQSEQMNFHPINTIYNGFENATTFIVRPSRVLQPMNDSHINFTLPVTPGQYLQSAKGFLVKMRTQMYHNEEPWTPAAPAYKEQSRISPINNIAPSLFKHINVRVNGNILNNNTVYSEHDYITTLAGTDMMSYNNGDLTKKGFWKETSGYLDETDCFDATTGATLPKNDNNKARQRLCEMYLQGKKVDLEFFVKCPITEQQTVFNASNKVQITFERHNPAYYLMATPDSAAGTSPAHTATTTAKDCSIRLLDMFIEMTNVEMNDKLNEQYTLGYTEEMPDKFIFTNHSVTNIMPLNNARTFDQQITSDKLPDKIVTCLIDQSAKIGHINKNPHIMLKYPDDTEWNYSVNGSSVNREKRKTVSEQYDLIRQTLNKDIKDPLITRDDYMFTGADNTKQSGYTMLAGNITFTGTQKNNTTSEDVRSANLRLKMQIPNGTTLPPNSEFQFNQFDRREFSISPSGQLARDYI